MSETIIPVDIAKKHEEDYLWYAIFVARRRVAPDERDGLKPVHRRVMWAAVHDERAYPKALGGKGTVKTATVVGTTIGKYHPHGSAAVSESIKPMVNWFEIKVPLFEGSKETGGGFGDPYGFRMSADRYTEIQLSQYSLDCIISELKDANNAVDWEPNFSDTILEPKYFPAAVPNLLINGSYGIATGFSVDIPRHNVNEVIDATINLMHHPNAKVVLVPDNCMDTDIIDTHWEKISRTGRGSYKVRARVEIIQHFNNDYHKDCPAIHVTSVPDLVFFNSIEEAINKMNTNKDKPAKLPQIIDIVNMGGQDEEDKANLDIYIILKKGSDPAYVRDVLFASTSLEKTRGVNFEILVDNKPTLMGYKEYLQRFINFRRTTKFRMYCNRMKEAKTKYHEMEFYIKVMESDEFEKIYKMLKKQKSDNVEEYVEYFVEKLKITDVQARYLLRINLAKLAPGQYKKYKKIMDETIKEASHCFDMMNSDELIDREIEEELKFYKQKYGRPRMSRIISKEEASNIPTGVFRVIITKGNCIKKMEAMTENIGSLGGDEPLCIFDADNRDNILIFSKLGKVFKLPVCKIPFGAKGNPGMDIRKLIKNLTSDICTVVVESNLKEFAKKKKNFIYVITQNGYIKRMDCQDFLNVAPSGIIFTKLEDDMVADVLFMSENMDLVIYSRNKVLRLNGKDVPYQKRSAKGQISIKSQFQINGMDCLYPKANELIVVTRNGYVNKIPLVAVQVSKRNRAGSSVIKLKKNDIIMKISVCCDDDNLIIYDQGHVSATIPIKDLKLGSSLGSGDKVCSNVMKADIVKG